MINKRWKMTDNFDLDEVSEASVIDNEPILRKDINVDDFDIPCGIEELGRANPNFQNRASEIVDRYDLAYVVFIFKDDKDPCDDIRDKGLCAKPDNQR